MCVRIPVCAHACACACARRARVCACARVCVCECVCSPARDCIGFSVSQSLAIEVATSKSAHSFISSSPIANASKCSFTIWRITDGVAPSHRTRVGSSGSWVQLQVHLVLACRLFHDGHGLMFQERLPHMCRRDRLWLFRHLISVAL